MIYTYTFNTPFGEMAVCGSEKELYMLQFVDSKTHHKILQTIENHFKAKLIVAETTLFKEVERQLREYFERERTSFDLPFYLIGTDFQKKVWTSLLQLPYGKSSTYKDQAKKIGNSKAIRAVANSNAQNKIAIIIPCHRVIGSNGKLTGYAGGIERKRQLLNLEYCSILLN